MGIKLGDDFETLKSILSDSAKFYDINIEHPDSNSEFTDSTEYYRTTVEKSIGYFQTYLIDCNDDKMEVFVNVFTYKNHISKIVVTSGLEDYNSFYQIYRTKYGETELNQYNDDICLRDNSDFYITKYLYWNCGENQRIYVSSKEFNEKEYASMFPHPEAFTRENCSHIIYMDLEPMKEMKKIRNAIETKKNEEERKVKDVNKKLKESQDI